MPSQFQRLILALAVAALGVGAALPASARDESREDRELRDDRDDGDDRDDRDDRDSDDRDDDDRDDDRDDDDRDDDDRDDDDRDDDDRDDDDDSRSNSGNNSGRRSGRVDVERNAQGGDRQRDEVVLIGNADNVAAVRQAGHRLRSERELESLRQIMIRVEVRDGQTIEELVRSLRAIAPGARVAPNHIFRPSQQTPATVGTAPMHTPADKVAAPRGRIDIGVIDTGAELTHARLQQALRAHKGFAPGGYRARAHGTAVAQLASSRGAYLAVADVFGVDRRNQLVAPAELIAAAIDWLLAKDVPVLNISIEGPHNEVLAFMIESAIARGALIVAAVGNGGPTAAPSYPAAYPGVIGVTALDQNGQIYRRAARGNHVQFAARGSYDKSQVLVQTSETLAGTSFAAPVVAAELARRCQDHPSESRARILMQMRAEAVDLGPAGKDNIYGWGGIYPH